MPDNLDQIFAKVKETTTAEPTQSGGSLDDIFNAVKKKVQPGSSISEYPVPDGTLSSPTSSRNSVEGGEVTTQVADTKAQPKAASSLKENVLNIPPQTVPHPERPTDQITKLVQPKVEPVIPVPEELKKVNAYHAAKNKDYELSNQILNTVTDDKDGYVYELMAHNQQAMGHYDGAKKLLVQAVDLNPSNARLYPQLAIASAKAGDEKVATQAADKYINFTGGIANGDENTALDLSKVWQVKGNKDKTDFYAKNAYFIHEDKAKDNLSETLKTMPEYLMSSPLNPASLIFNPLNQIATGLEDIAKGVKGDEATYKETSPGVKERVTQHMTPWDRTLTVLGGAFEVGMGSGSFVFPGEGVGGLMQEANELKGSVSALRKVGTVATGFIAPELAQFNLELNLFENIAPQKLVELVTAPVTSAIVAAGYDPEDLSKTSKGLVNIGNMLGMMIMQKGSEALKDKAVDRVRDLKKDYEAFSNMEVIYPETQQRVYDMMKGITVEETKNIISVLQTAAKVKADTDKLKEYQQTTNEPTYRVNNVLVKSPQEVLSTYVEMKKQGITPDISIMNDVQGAKYVSDMLQQHENPPPTSPEVKKEVDTKALEGQSKLGLPTRPEVFISPETDNVISKIDANEPVTNDLLNDASTQLYGEYKRLAKLKESTTRQHTVSQIDQEMQTLADHIQKLEDMRQQQTESGDFVRKHIEPVKELPVNEKSGENLNPENQPTALKTELENQPITLKTEPTVADKPAEVSTPNIEPNGKETSQEGEGLLTAPMDKTADTPGQQPVGSVDKQTVIDEINALPLSHVEGRKMDNLGAKGTFLSAEQGNRYGDGTGAKVDIKNPFVIESEQQMFDEAKARGIKKGSDVKKMRNKLFDALEKEGYDAVWLKGTDLQEGEVYVMDRGNVKLVKPVEPTTEPTYKSQSGEKVYHEGNKIRVFDADGKEIPSHNDATRKNKDIKGVKQPPTKYKVPNPKYQKVVKEYAKSVDLDTGESAFTEGDQPGEGADLNAIIADKSTNPREIAQAYIDEQNNNPFIEGSAKDEAILKHISHVVGGEKTNSPGSFRHTNDKANVDKGMRLNWFREDGTTLDEVARLASAEFGDGEVVSPNDVAEFIIKYPHAGDYERKNASPNLEALKIQFEHVTGIPLDDAMINRVANERRSALTQSEELSDAKLKEAGKLPSHLTDIIKNEGIDINNVDSFENHFIFDEGEFEQVKKYLENERANTGEGANAGSDIRNEIHPGTETSGEAVGGETKGTLQKESEQRIADIDAELEQIKQDRKKESDRIDKANANIELPLGVAKEGELLGADQSPIKDKLAKYDKREADLQAEKQRILSNQENIIAADKAQGDLFSEKAISYLQSLLPGNKPLDNLDAMGYRDDNMWKGMINGMIEIVRSNENTINRIADLIQKFKDSDFYKGLTGNEKTSADNDLDGISRQFKPSESKKDESKQVPAPENIVPEPVKPPDAPKPDTKSKVESRTSPGDTDTSLKRAVADNEKTNREGPDAVDHMVDKLQDTNVQTIYDNAKASVDDRKVNPKDVTKRIIKDGHGSVHDEAVLLYDRSLMRNEEISLQNQLKDATGKAREELSVKIEKLYLEMNDNDLAAAKIGREASLIFTLRQFYVNSEHTIYGMEREYAAGHGYSELSPEQKAYVKERYEQLKDAENKLKERQDQFQKDKQEHDEKRAMDNIVNQKPKYKPENRDVKKRFNAIAKHIEDSLIFDEGGLDNIISMGSGVDVRAWNDAVREAAKTIRKIGDVAQAVKDGLKKLTETDWFKGLTDENKEKVKSVFSSKMRDAYKIDESFKTDSEDATPGEIRIPAKLIRQFAEDGIDNIEDMTKAVKDAMKDKYPNATDREIRDAITKYGKTINPNEEEIAVSIRKMTRIGRLISGIEDALGGNRPLRSGLQRDKPGVDERAMRKELAELVKDIPMNDADLQKYQKSALDAIKTRLTNRIEELQNEIDTGQKKVINKKITQLDEDAKQLTYQRDELKKIHDEIFGKTELTDEQRIEQALDRISKATDDVNKRIKDNDIELKKKKTVNSPAIVEAQKEFKARKEVLDDMRRDAGILEREYNRRLLQSINTRKAKLEEKLKNRDFSKPVKVEHAKVKEVDDAMAEYKKLQFEWKLEQQKELLKNRPGWEKFVDKMIQGWVGFGLLSGGRTLGKLFSFSAYEIMLGEPLDMLETAMVRVLLPKTSKMSITEGHLNLNAVFGKTEGNKGFYQTLLSKQTFKEAKDYIKNRNSYIDEMWGDISKRLPNEFRLNFGKIHGVEKYPLRKADFSKNFIKIENYFRNQGMDVTDHANRKMIGAMALAKADYRIMMGKNALSTLLRNTQGLLYQKAMSSSSNAASIGWKTAYYVSKAIFPIVSVPTNYTIRTGRSWGGILEFTYRMFADRKSMTPELADKALLALKNQLPGVAIGYIVLGTGLVAINKDKDLVIGGWKVPTWTTHHPLVLTAKLFAEAKEAFHKKKGKGGFGQAMGTMALETLHETPYLSDRVLGMIDSPTAFDNFMSNFMISLAEPQLIKDIALWADPSDKKRQPKTFMEKVKMGIPGKYGRNSVPFKKTKGGGFVKKYN